MDLETLFTLANAVVLPGWALLVVAPRWRWTQPLAAGVLPGIVALLYLGLAVVGLGQGEGSFGSLAGVRALFARDEALLAGWLHYLAFDLLIGAWEVRDAQRRSAPHALVVPCVALTLVLGPLGWLAWVLVRGGGSRRGETEARS